MPRVVAEMEENNSSFIFGIEIQHTEPRNIYSTELGV